MLWPGARGPQPAATCCPREAGSPRLRAGTGRESSDLSWMWRWIHSLGLQPATERMPRTQSSRAPVRAVVRLTSLCPAPGERPGRRTCLPEDPGSGQGRGSTHLLRPRSRNPGLRHPPEVPGRLPGPPPGSPGSRCGGRQLRLHGLLPVSGPRAPRTCRALCPASRPGLHPPTRTPAPLHLKDQGSSCESSAARLYRDSWLGGAGLLERKLSASSRLDVALRSDQS